MKITSSIWIILIFLVLFIILYACRTQYILPSSSAEPFTDIVPDLKSGQQTFNSFMSLVNLVDPSIQLQTSTETNINQALVSPVFNGQESGVSAVNGISPPYKIPKETPQTIKLAHACEKVKKPDCSAFDDPTFAQNCGISFDKKGTDSRGKSHMGGLFLSQQDRASGAKTPTIGSSSKGYFAPDKDSCTVIKETIACREKHSFSVPNCSQCLTSSEWTRVDPSIPIVPPSLVLMGNGQITITAPNATVNTSLSTSAPITVSTLGLKESDIFTLNVSGDPTDCYVAGYITGQTARGSFNYDINNLIDIDLLTNYKPRLSGSQLVNSVMCMVLVPAVGADSMNLRAHLPFSFISPYESDAKYCDNGPFITQATSATFLQSDPCYGSSEVPGKYSTSCLQQTFVQNGCTTTGTGYPNSSSTTATLLIDPSGNPRTIDAISDYINTISVQASTGRDDSGKTLKQADWNTASMFCTGESVLTPCGPSDFTGTPSQDCLVYLYNNGGATNSTGPTYTLGSNYTSLSNNNQVYCRPEGTLNPATSAGLAATLATANSVASAKALYNSAHIAANNNSLPNDQRIQAMLQCYGTSVIPQNT